MYRLARILLRLLLPLRLRLAAEGVDHVPREGAFFLVANHESILDAVLVQVSCPRPVHAMTKSSQFRGVWSGLLVRLKAFPTRRYRVDAQAARTALRLLEQGKGVAVYPEGERSWDGRLQPLRRGAVRLLLTPGVPVVPCAVSGSYHRLPRWSRRLARGDVTVRFGPPLELGAHHGPEARRRALPGALERVREALEALRESGAADAAEAVDAPEAAVTFETVGTPGAPDIPERGDAVDPGETADAPGDPDAADPGAGREGT